MSKLKIKIYTGRVLSLSMESYIRIINILKKWYPLIKNENLKCG